MIQTEFQAFADNYTSADFDKIKFDWNGEHADKFHDNNGEFRMKLCEYLIPQLDTVKLELIRDLYNELAKYANEVWGVYDKFHLFGQQLLVRGGTKYLMDYMQGASLSMDTYLGSGRIEISKELAQKILNILNDKIKTSSDIHEKKLAEGFLKRFQWLATK
ncbi:MAG: hypothetical protein ACT4OJ_03325 [Bacteroidota bacterium]